MKPRTRCRTKTFCFVIGIACLFCAPGCTEDNNTAFLKDAPPGPKDEHAGESFAERRARTRRMSKNEIKIEAKRKAEAEKKAAAEKAR